MSHPRALTIVDHVAARCHRRPDAVALVDQGGAVSFGELWSRACGVAASLAPVVDPGEVVALAADRGADFVTAALGTWLAGCSYLPLDMSNPDSRLRTMVDEVRPAALLSSTAYDDVGAQLGVNELSLARTAVGAPWPDERRHDGDIAYVICTSGTTGTPKGAAVGHAALANLARWFTTAHGITEHDRMLHTAALGFDAAVLELWPQLAAGATVVCCPDEDRMLPEAVADWIARNRCTRVFLPTALCEAALAGGFAPPGLRTMFTGGDHLLLPAQAPRHFRLVNMYGLTELTVVSAAHEVRDGATGDHPPLGRPIDGVRILLCDEDGAEVPAGEVGEIHVGGACLGAGYPSAPELTRRRFITLPDRAGTWYRTGDLGYWADEGLHFAGRTNSEQLKVRGARVDPTEIEAALLGVPGVRGAAVTVVGHGADGELVAVVAGEDQSDARALRTNLLGRLPSFLVPQRYVIVERLPLTANGKLDRVAVSALAGAAPSLTGST